MDYFMCKTIKNRFDSLLTFDKLLQAHNRASIGKRTKPEIINFEMDLETNIIKLMKELKNGTYKIGKYREFTIYEPKKRIIKSLPYRDRIVHQWYIEEFIKPFMLPRFIKDTYACLDKKGTLEAVLATQKYMRKMQKKYGSYYVLQCDIHKFFYSIDKKILTNILNRRITDQKLKDFTHVILDDGNNLGIPIGNYTSQYFANIYLNELDHYIKEILQVKYYVRYMDDFVLLVKTKSEAKYFLNKITIYLTERLHLELNQKSRFYPSYQGINFCGYRIFETHILLRKRFIKKVKRNIVKWNYLYKNGNIHLLPTQISWNSIKAHAKHANSYTFMKKMSDKLQIKSEANFKI